MKTSKRTKVRTWYGMDGTVIIGPGLRHKSGIGTLIIPHPAAVNWLLRLGLLENCSSTLRINHEIGHLQSAPLAVLYTAANYTAIITANQVNLFNLILVFICTHAAQLLLVKKRLCYFIVQHLLPPVLMQYQQQTVCGLSG